MKKAHYRLQPVFDLREKARDEAARVVTRRRQLLAEAEAVLAMREQAVIECRQRRAMAQAEFDDRSDHGGEVCHLVNRRIYLADLRLQEEMLREEAERQRVVVSRAAADLDAAVSRLMEAITELRAVEKHRELWQEAERRQNARHEQKSSDEIAGILHEHRRHT